jgi:LmbE family N-acetylglucosaminyl deacetylase
MNPYEQYVQTLSDLLARARDFPLGGWADYPRPTVAAEAPVALVFSPHPDDEVIIGGWPLRLLRESRWRVVNVAVTQGSNRERQAPRWQELVNCCRCIGFELVPTSPTGLEGVTPRTRTGDPARWEAMVAIIAHILASHEPRAIFFPHEADWNSTHIGTHHLVVDALRRMPADFSCAAVETEFWAQMPSPNVLVESAPGDVAALVTALTWHVGEVRRNPYHLTLPAWMTDNVRRGGEVVGGQGGAAPGFHFGTLYRLQAWREGRFASTPAAAAGFLAAGDDPAAFLGSAVDA